jgi:hypothetical protein
LGHIFSTEYVYVINNEAIIDMTGNIRDLVFGGWGICNVIITNRVVISRGNIGKSVYGWR